MLGGHFDEKIGERLLINHKNIMRTIVPWTSARSVGDKVVGSHAKTLHIMKQVNVDKSSVDDCRAGSRKKKLNAIMFVCDGYQTEAYSDNTKMQMSRSYSPSCLETDLRRDVAYMYVRVHDVILGRSPGPHILTSSKSPHCRSPP